MEKTRKVLTLTIIHDHPRMLLGMKKKGFGAGRWNGFGGKVEAGESIGEAAIREVREKSGLEVFNLEKYGIIEFESKSNEDILEVHIFKSSEFRGEPRESDEMSPRWFFLDEIPFSEMWSSDLYWYPRFMRGKKFRGKFIFDENDKVVDYLLNEVESL